MKCNSCSTDIPPAWKAAISSNKCPACGGEIMNTPMQTLLEEIREALIQMPADPEGLAGWLLSNYQLIKIGTGEPVQEFYGAKPQRQRILAPGMEGSALASAMSKEDELRNGGMKIHDNKLQQFYANAGYKPKKSYEELLRQIQDNGGGLDYGAREHEHDDGSIDEALPENADYTHKALAAMNGGTPGTEMNQQDKAAIRAMMRENLSNQAPQDDDLHPALQQDRENRLRKQQDLSLGGSIGKITRSS